MTGLRLEPRCPAFTPHVYISSQYLNPGYILELKIGIYFSTSLENLLLQTLEVMENMVL